MTTKATLARALALPLFALCACGGEAQQSAPAPEPATIAAAAQPTAAGSSAAAATIPARFIGVWDGEQGTCDPASDLRVDIGPQLIGFYESQGTLTRVAESPDGAAMLDLAMEGEGDQWAMTMTIRVTGADAGERLIIQHKAQSGEPAPQPLTLKRCPG